MSYPSSSAYSATALAFSGLRFPLASTMMYSIVSPGARCTPLLPALVRQWHLRSGLYTHQPPATDGAAPPVRGVNGTGLQQVNIFFRLRQSCGKELLEIVHGFPSPGFSAFLLQPFDEDRRVAPAHFDATDFDFVVRVPSHVPVGGGMCGSIFEGGKRIQW